MNGYEINAAVRAAMVARKKAWLAALTSGSEVCVMTEGMSATTAVVVRLTATQLVLSNDCRANRESGTLRGTPGSICEPGTAEIERENRAKIVAAAERLAERVAYSLSECREGRNNEPLATGDAVVTADGQTGIVARLWASTTTVVLDKLDSRGRKVQATFKKDCVYKLLAAVGEGMTRSTTPARAQWLQSLAVGDVVIEQKIGVGITRTIEYVRAIDVTGILLSSGARYSIKDGGGAGENNIVKYVPGHVAHVFEGGWVTNGEYANMISAAKSIKCGESVVICEKDGTVRTVTPTPATAPTRRAPGAGRPRLTAPTKQVFGRIPAALLPELIKRGGVARILIDALSKKLT